NIEDKRKYYRLASLHNLRFIIRLTEDTRQAILEDRFTEFKEAFLKSYYPQKNK
ncbi:queuine tRNA-ribosyltransferase family protein, partial [Erysipelatoclostridium ramosum]|nr:queuine tRNA-ribosyltransferase family protein [Thomasclavelia ramosa]